MSRFSLYTRLRKDEPEPPSKAEIADFVARMRHEDDLLHLAEHSARADKADEYETSLALAYKQIRMLEEALHNEKLVSDALRRKLAIYESNLPSVPPPLFAEGLVASTVRPSASVSEWRVRLDELQKNQLDRLTARR